MSQIPKRKHSKEELADLRAKKAMQMAGQEVVNPYDKKQAKKPVILLGYLCALVAPLYLIILKLKNTFGYEMSDLKIMSVGTLLAILIALFIFITRSLSRHHASFMIIIALISSFSMVYLVNQEASLKREVMIMLGQPVSTEKSEADLILEASMNKGIEKGNANSNAISGRRQLTPEQIQLREEARQAFAESEAENARKFESEQTLRELKKIKESGGSSE